jgi:hypothetical protein
LAGAVTAEMFVAPIPSTSLSTADLARRTEAFVHHQPVLHVKEPPPEPSQSEISFSGVPTGEEEPLNKSGPRADAGYVDQAEFSDVMAAGL